MITVIITCVKPFSAIFANNLVSFFSRSKISEVFIRMRDQYMIAKLCATGREPCAA